MPSIQGVGLFKKFLGGPPGDDVPKTILGQKQPGNRKIPVSIHTREEAMKKLSVVTMFALFVSLICLGSASFTIAQSNDLTNPNGHDRKKVPDIVGSWRGTGQILARGHNPGEINVVIDITNQYGELFYGTMDVSLNYGYFVGIGLFENSSFSCPIAGNIDPKGNLTISGGTVYKFFYPTDLPPNNFTLIWMMSSLKQEGTALLYTGPLRRILGNFRGAVQPILFTESFEPQLNNPPGAAFSGSFAVHEAPLEMK
jgi:hypothetical protein